MYLLKAKAQQEEEERKEALERRKKAYEEQRRRQKQGNAAGQRVPVNVKPRPTQEPPRIVHKAEKDARSKGFSKKAKYVASFRVKTGSGRAQARFVGDQLVKLSEPKKPKSIVLVVQTEGIKVLSEDEKTVYMAHALFRISYTTVFTGKHYFAFVAKNPGGNDAPSFCHVMKTDKKEAAQELNKEVGDYFKATYAEQTLRREKKSGQKKDRPQMPLTPVVPRSTFSAPQAQPPKPASQHPPPQQVQHGQPQLPPKKKQQQHLSPAIQLQNHHLRAAPPPPNDPSPPSYAESNETSLHTASWYQAGIPREIALQILEQESEGAFLVRDSQSQPGSHVLSLKCPPNAKNPAGATANFLIVSTPKGLNLKSLSEKFFPDLTSLINYYSSTADRLPCRLNLHSSNPAFAENEDNLEDEMKTDDPDYCKMTDFDAMLAELDSL